VIEIGRHETPKVLIVDDETEVLHSLADLLRKDFHIFATSDINEAQSLLISHDMFSLVISDQRMPVLTGAEFLARVAKISPDTARILLTGYADLDAIIEAVNQGQIVQYITKPWDAVKLLEMLKPIAERHQLVQENRRLIQKMAHLKEIETNAFTRIETLEETQSTLQSENQTLKEAYDLLDKSFWHLRKIQEMLPICMECGKVKTADSSWEDVVSFLKKNTRFLSHGYCPECYAKAVAEFNEN
jgi:response regulator RpfG family c-di-GMP phosphodiesterase